MHFHTSVLISRQDRHELSSPFLRFLIYKNFVLKDQQFASKDMQKTPGKIDSGPSPYGPAHLLPIQLGAKYLALVVLDNHNRAHSRLYTYVYIHIYTQTFAASKLSFQQSY